MEPVQHNVKARAGNCALPSKFERHRNSRFDKVSEVVPECELANSRISCVRYFAKRGRGQRHIGRGRWGAILSRAEPTNFQVGPIHQVEKLRPERKLSIVAEKRERLHDGKV